MNEEINEQENDANSQETNQVISILKRLQQQMTFIEKKLDQLLNQGSQQERPFQRREFREPFRPFHKRERFGGRDDSRDDRGPRGGGDRDEFRGRKSFFKRNKHKFSHKSKG